MLKIKVYFPNNRKTISLPSIKEGDRGGSITDYHAMGEQIIHFHCLKDGSAKIMRLKDGRNIEIGITRISMPDSKEEIKTLQPGEKFRFLYNSKFGDAILIFECTQLPN